MEKYFNLNLAPLEGEDSKYFNALHYEHSGLSDSRFWVTLDLGDWTAQLAQNELQEELTERGNLTLAYDPFTSAKYYFYRVTGHVTSGTVTTAMTSTRPVTVGLRLNCKHFFENWFTGDFHWKHFNRLYSDYFLAHYSRGIPLTETVKESLLVLHCPLTFNDYEKMTVGYTKWHSLLWNNCAPVPTWVTHVTGTSTGEEDTATPATGTSSSSTGTGNDTGRLDALITEALAKALLLVTETTGKKK